ncbi:hypothetical protein XM38_030190 [Halomicronema hongdechloris C2206]|uniref:Uncharacterized protein n=1 Tax=Halomicronema hongdechloris C2206 TaxID=1641165 RepID=A0A1Z3HP49_9CYAN|nr:YihY/virulence factor BrkB family protein [Halomicronema hongdechloris]ASC72065.1 hypothetical protein XM38_030190 [Halomicronema hongdechloris C2206]
MPWKSRWVKLIGRTCLKWQQDDCLSMGAALAYYALFSLFPIILVILSIVGIFIGPNTYAYNQIIVFTSQALPPDAFEVVQETLLRLHEDSTGASIVGFIVLLFTASGFFGALSRSFDKIWRTESSLGKRGHIVWAVVNVVWQRLFAFILVLSSTSLIFLSLLLNIAIDMFLAILEQFSSQLALPPIDQVTLLPWLQWGVSFVLLTLVVMVLFKVLPSTRVAWGDIWLGALVTALLLVGLQQLISNSVISLGSRFRSYGVIGGVMVLMLWIYLTSQVFFFGGELTYVYARLFGSRRPPPMDPESASVSDGERVDSLT